MGALRLLPAAALAPYAASLGDRFRRERFLLAVSLVGAAALGASAAAAALDVPAVVYGAAAVVGVSSTLFRPALQALLPSLAQTPEELIAANSTTSLFESAGTLLGPIAAALLIAVADIATAFAAGAAALVVGSALLARVHVERGAAPRRADVGVRAGLRALTQVHGAPTLVLLMVAQTFVRGCLNVLIVVAAFQTLHGGSTAVGILTAALGVGGLLGASLGTAIDARRLVPAFGVALLLWGVPIAPLGFVRSIAVAACLAAVIGASNSVEDVAGFTLLQRVVANDVLAAALGIFWGLAMGATALGSVAAPPLHAHWGRGAFVIVAAVLPVLVLLSARRLRRIAHELVPSEHLVLIDAVPMFAPLGLAAKEQLAARLEPLHVDAGAVVIRKGDAGDSFYLVAAGALEATVEVASPPREVGRFFGEIALLRDVRRTATVRAVTGADLLVLSRDDFLAALDGHRAAGAAAAAVADARLAAT